MKTSNLWVQEHQRTPATVIPNSVKSQNMVKFYLYIFRIFTCAIRVTRPISISIISEVSSANLSSNNCCCRQSFLRKRNPLLQNALDDEGSFNIASRLSWIFFITSLGNRWYQIEKLSKYLFVSYSPPQFSIVHVRK